MLGYIFEVKELKIKNEELKSIIKELLLYEPLHKSNSLSKAAWDRARMAAYL